MGTVWPRFSLFIRGVACTCFPLQIVLQDAADDELPAPTSTHHEEYMEDEVKGGQSMDHQRLYHMEDEPRDFRSGGPGPWMDFYPHPEPWESETMMGMGGGPMHPMNMRPGSRMGIDGPGPFPMGPGIPMGPPGPDFGMFPGGPFGVLPFERYYLLLLVGTNLPMYTLL